MMKKVVAFNIVLFCIYNALSAQVTYTRQRADGSNDGQSSSEVVEKKQPNLQIEVTLIDPLKEPMGMTASGLYLGQSPLRQILVNMFKTPASTISSTDKFILDKWADVKIMGIPPQEFEFFNSVFKKSIEIAFNINIKKETKKIQGWKITAPNGVTKDLHVSKETSGSYKASSAKGIITASNVTMDNLIKMQGLNLSKTLNGLPLANHTGLTDRFDFQLYFEDGDQKSLIKAFEEQLGLVLELGQIEQEIYVIEPKPKRQPAYTITRTKDN